MMRQVISVLVCVAGAAVLARAQCEPEWLPGKGVPGVNSKVYALTLWDPDGPGPAPTRLVAGGAFKIAGRSQLSDFDLT